MKAVLISIRPEWVKKILDGEKTVEVRKTAPKLKPPFKCYIYCTEGELSYKVGNGMICHNNGGKMVVAEFVCNHILSTCGWRLTGDTGKCAPTTVSEKCLPFLSCLTLDELLAYAGSPNRLLYGWYISELKVYDHPKKLEEFTPHCRFMTDDMLSCTSGVTCLYQHRDYNPDGSLNVVTCKRRVGRPPQSWCYVEDTIHD